MIHNPIKFGTDGWRGLIAEDFTFDNVRICAQGFAAYLKESGLAERGVVIGYDTRFASEHFATAAAEVTTASGIRVYLSPKAAPTPVVSFGVTRKASGGAIVITASHNPAAWNGFKVKNEAGASAPTNVITELEKHIASIFPTGKTNRLNLEQAQKLGLLEYYDIQPVYSEHIGKLIDLDSLRHAELKVVIDSMYGAGAGYFRNLLANGTIELIEINGERNPSFPGIQPEPIAVNLAKLSSTVKQQGANVGIAVDGDADRVGIIDENGEFLTQLQVFALLCLYFLEIRGERGPLVKTITTTSMIQRLGELYNVPVYETQVGFKYVAPIMIEKKALIGGEESGGYGFKGHIPERDGILAGLYFLDFMVKTGKSPSELLKYLYDKVGAHHYKRVDVEFPAGQRQAIVEHIQTKAPKDIDNVKVVKTNTADGFHFILADGSWLLIRFSGTEPILRVYAESSSPERVDRLLEFGQGLTGLSSKAGGG